MFPPVIPLTLGGTQTVKHRFKPNCYYLALVIKIYALLTFCRYFLIRKFVYGVFCVIMTLEVILWVL